MMSCQNRESALMETESGNDSLYREAKDFLDKGQSDSAFILFDEAKDAYLEAKDSTWVAFCMIQMAITLTETGDYFGAEELSFQTLKYLDHTDTSHYNMISSNYNNIANATGQLGHFEEALPFYDKALKYATNQEQKRNILNNKAVTLFDLRRFDDALEIYEKLMVEKRTKNVSYARALTNYARTKWRVDKSYNPLPDFWKAKSIREASQDMGEHSSIYAHIAEYYEGRNVDSAIFYARKRMAVALHVETPEDLRNALTMLIRLESSDSSKSLIERYKVLQDSVNSSRLLSKNQFASARYEAEKNKVDNAQLKNSLSEKTQKINLQRVLALIAGLCILLFVTWGYVRSKQRKERMKSEAAERIRVNQLRTLRKVHDVVANGLYRVMSEITYIEVIDKEDVLDKIEDMYNLSRDISYEAEGDNLEI